MRSKLKCRSKCDQLRVEASRLREKVNYFDAILTLNKALCYAETDQAAVIYSDRAEICLELKFFKKCLENVEKAKNCGVENDELREKVKNLLSKGEKSRDDVENFFSMPTSTNPQIPFIADCLALKENIKFGRGIFAKRDIKTGEVVAMEKPIFKILNKDVRHKRCANCFLPNMLTLIPCDRYCISTMFCDDQCRNEAWKKYHKYECDTLESQLDNNEYDLMIKKSLFEAITLFDGSVSKMMNFIGKSDNETLFDFDLSKGSEKEKGKIMLKATCALTSAVNSDEDHAMVNWMLRNDPAIKTLIFNKLEEMAVQKFMLKLMGISDRNSYLLYDLKCKKTALDEEIGSGILAFASLFNHSCNPNLYRFFSGNQQVYVAKRPIESGQQLFVGYMQNFTVCDRNERQMTLEESFFFKCSCDACTENYPLFKDLKRVDNNFRSPPTSVTSREEAERKYKENCEYIESICKKFPPLNYELFKSMHSSFYLLQYLANKNVLLN